MASLPGSHEFLLIFLYLYTNIYFSMDTIKVFPNTIYQFFQNYYMKLPIETHTQFVDCFGFIYEITLFTSEINEKK